MKWNQENKSSQQPHVSVNILDSIMQRHLISLFNLCMIAVPWNREIIDRKVTLQKLSGLQKYSAITVILFDMVSPR